MKGKLNLETAKEKGFEIVETQILKNGKENPNAIVEVVSLVTDRALIEGKKYKCHPKTAKILIDQKKVKLVK